jgi:hypothetical protein
MAAVKPASLRRGVDTIVPAGVFLGTVPRMTERLVEGAGNRAWANLSLKPSFLCLSQGTIPRGWKRWLYTRDVRTFSVPLANVTE